MDALAQLAKIRLSLGRHLYGLSLRLVLPTAVNWPDEHQVKQLRRMDIQIVQLDKIPPELSQSSVWVVNPEGRLVLVYRDEMHPKAIFSDLQHLAPLWEK
jgi:hypothetical protein